MTLGARSLPLSIGYIAGVAVFFGYDILWGDSPGGALRDVSWWLPLHLIYFVIILFISGRVRVLNKPLILGINGFVIAACSVLAALPPYMNTAEAGFVTILADVVLFLVINAVAIGVTKDVKESRK